MSSLNSVLSTAVSGLQTAQVGLRTVSDNVANVNTAGYVRKVVDQQSLAVQGRGIGVGVAQVTTAANQYLDSASRNASSDAGSASATSDLLDQAQTLFGDPNSASSFFSQIDTVFSSFISLAAAPSTTTRGQAVPQVQSLFTQAGQIAQSISGLQAQATTRIGADVDTVNGLLTQIASLNSDISRATAQGGDASGAQDQQAQALDQLSALLPVQVAQRSGGGVVVRTSDGLALVDQTGPASLAYDGSAAAGVFTATSASGVVNTLATPGSGEIGGLSKLRDSSLPALTGQLSELVGQTATALNAVHNQYSAVPPPTSLTGRDTGLDADTALAHFTGQETVAVTDSRGVPSRAAVIDFDARTVSVNGSVAGSFTDAASFTSALNTALGGQATADFTDTPPTITGADTSTTSATRLVLAGGALQADGTITGSAASKGGQGFSAVFGLNDLVTSTGLSSFATGLQGGDTAGFTTGAISFRVAAADGSTLRNVTVNAPGAGGSVNTLLATLNSPSSGVGLYGSFALDPTGALAFTPNASGASLQVTSDTTARNGTGPSISALFGIGDAVRGARLGQLSVRADIQADPSKLALAAWNPAGNPPLSAGDGAGADALAQAANGSVSFAAVGGASAVQTTLSDYASAFGASTARAAASASDAATSATAVKTEADTRRSSTEGVDIDQELVNLTTYQQAYSASARLIQAVKDVYDALLNIV